MSIGATSAGGFNALSTNWAIAEEKAREAAAWTAAPGAWSGRCTSPRPANRPGPRSPSGWRSGSIISATIAALPLVADGDGDLVDQLIASGLAVIGTPEDAIAQIERLQAQSGGFGASC